MKGAIIYFACLVGLGSFSGCLPDAPSEPTFEEQLSKDKGIIDTYLKSKAVTSALSDPDGYGVKYIVTSAGTGIKPIVDDTVQVNYKLKLLPSETLIQNPTTPVKFLLGKLIPGWQIGLPLIKEGSKATFYIPSGWGYGTATTLNIPANSNLIFEVELLKVDPQMTRDTVAIDAYLQSKSIAAIKDRSGIRYVVTKSATGIKPTLESTVTFTYEGKTLIGNTETTFQQNSFTGKVSSIIKGLQIGLPLIPVGSEVTFYIPSPLGYKLYGTQDGIIPPKTNLIYNIKFTAIQ